MFAYSNLIKIVVINQILYVFCTLSAKFCNVNYLGNAFVSQLLISVNGLKIREALILTNCTSLKWLPKLFIVSFYQKLMYFL